MMNNYVQLFLIIYSVLCTLYLVTNKINTWYKNDKAADARAAELINSLHNLLYVEPRELTKEEKWLRYFNSRTVPAA